jgi:splicing factor 3A subunit 3
MLTECLRMASGVLHVSQTQHQNLACYGLLFLNTGHKMYTKQTVYDAHLKSKKHLKAAARTDTNTSTSAATSDTNGIAHAAHPKSKLYNPARLTYLTHLLLKDLHSVIVETRANVERRFSLTARERELELEAPAPPPSTATGVVEEEEEEEKIYNPLKLPLGWDGKPIPYWLYKLHGLGVEYRCEICSDAVYMGR